MACRLARHEGSLLVGKAKGTDIAFLRKRLRALDSAAEQKFIGLLSAEEKKIYETATPVGWVPIETSARLQELAAPIIFPDNPDCILELGREQARDDLSGLYKIIVRFITIPALMKKLSSLWHSYNDTGDLKAVWQEGHRSGQLIIENYPALPLTSRLQIQGYFLGALEMTGAKNVRLINDFTDPLAYKYFGSWE
ncbi:MAG: hypothetical protein AB1439_06935 [candidate division FCPU426 bacterium]